MFKEQNKLPPRKLQYSGGIERANRTFREEFYARKNLLADSISSMQHELSKAVDKYNTYRPYLSLNGFTPMQYILTRVLFKRLHEKRSQERVYLA